jgi:hypothetical protein
LYCWYVQLNKKTQPADVAETPFSPGCRAFVYQTPKEDDSDAESIAEELWGVDQEAEDDGDEDEDEIGEEEDDGEEEDEEHEDNVSECSELPEEIRRKTGHYFLPQI